MMHRYYNKKGRLVGRAWALATCNNARSFMQHKPHSHNPPFTSYGPYMCEGYPARKIYDQPKRKPVN